jgi:hypothetical protein
MCKVVLYRESRYKAGSSNLEIGGEVVRYRLRPLYISKIRLRAYLIGIGRASESVWMMWNPRGSCPSWESDHVTCP